VGRASQARLLLTAIGSYQLEQVLKASRRLTEFKVPHAVNYLLEPGRFHQPYKKAWVDGSQVELMKLFPASIPLRLFATHTRPEPMLGLLQPLNTGTDQTAALGFSGRGGTLSTAGMLFVNGCSWAHQLVECARLLETLPSDLLTPEEIGALEGKSSPQGVII
jgi:phosphoketolase